MDHRNVVRQLLLEDTVEIFAAADCRQAVRVCQIGENADLVAAFKLCSGCHFFKDEVGMRM